MNKDERRIFIQRLDRLLKKMKGLFADTYIRAIEELKDAIRSGVKFEWKDYVAQTAQIEKMLDILAGKTELIIADGLNHSYQSGINAAVNRINQRYEEINAKYKKRRELNQIQKQATKTIRADVAKSNEGKTLKLSSRVWSLQDQAKDEIQILVNNAIAEGKGAKDMRNYVLKYLNNPKLFTMYVRNKETGELELSDTAKKMHPGRGVYRDPLKNAERLLRTEMLAAYRRAEIEAYQRNPLVIGYEIKTSGNHTTMKMGKPVPLKDICDKLQGRYPKTFMWTGWHPNCRCILLPITVPDGQLKDFFKAQDEGRAEEWNKQHGVQLPSKINTWIDDNKTRIYAVAGNPQRALPQWIEENKKQLNITKIEDVNVENAPAQKTILYPDMPAGLSESQQQKWIEINKKISALLKIEQGEPMTFETADEMRANPHYVAGSGSGYTINCASSVFANELRRRGFDVEATMNTRQNANVAYQLSKQTEMAWIDPATNRAPIPIKAGYIPPKPSDEWQVFQSIERSYRDSLAAKGTKFEKFVGVNTPDEAIYLPNGRYHLRIKWGGDFGDSGGHIVSFEKLGPGQYRFLDAQTGKLDTLTRLISAGNAKVEYYRVDNLMPNPDYIGAVAKSGTTKPSKIKYAKKKGGWSGSMY